jgi:flagellar hook-associated protein 1 FlgK
MGVGNLANIGISGMNASKAAVATTGHNISNANTEGYSRQRVETEANVPRAFGGKGYIGTGTLISRVSRTNDQYLEKQIRNANRDMSFMEEKEMALHQVEDIFNEMNGDGINRLVSRFFNEFRKLGNEPENEAIRQSVREASQAVVNDFHRLREEIVETRKHIDARLEGYTQEINQHTEELKDLNLKIRQLEVSGAPANDLQDKRDQVLKKLASYMDVSAHTDNNGNYTVDIRGVGPLVVNSEAEKFSVYRSPADDQGKSEGAFEIKTSASAQANVTHQIKGGKLGALLEVRDQLLSSVLDRLDEMAYNLSTAVNEVHSQGFTRNGAQGIAFFEPMAQKERASEFIGLSQAIQASASNIATAAIPDAPGDNRIALALAGLQSQKLMGDGKVTVDDWYNSMVSDIGVASSRNKMGINQQKDIMLQLNKMRDQISGVSIDEETANLMQFQHTYDASAKVISVADEMLKTVLEIKR